MIKQIIRLIKPGLFLPCFVNEAPRPDKLLVKPVLLSICAADQRYFQGNRPPEVLKKKLPISLFHEAIGEVLYDPQHILPKGSHCVLLPGGIDSDQEESNYREGAFFRSSNADGFCQEFMYLSKEEIIPINDKNYTPYIFSELMSVCIQGLHRLEEVTKINSETRVGIWGDGAMAYLMALALYYLKPGIKIYILGKHDNKLINFSFATKRINIADSSDNSRIDVAIECVGGAKAQEAIHQAIHRLVPKGVLLLLGVSEIAPTIFTRLVLEKGLTLLGSSRSCKRDFELAVKLIENFDVQNSLYKIISSNKEVRNSEQLIDVMKEDVKLPYKTIIKLIM